MKQQETDLTALSFKQYRDKFGKAFTLQVIKRAYGYAQNGHLPQNGIPTAAVLYAEPLKNRALFHYGLMAQKELNAVKIWDLKTETATAQRELQNGQWDFHNRALCMARLGENYSCTQRTTLDFPSNLIIGVYEHYHRFVAVVSVEEKPESALLVPKVQELANTIAKNALHYYPLYLQEQEKREYYRTHSSKGKNRPKLPEFQKFLLTQPLRFVDGVNPELEYELVRTIKPAVTIEEFLANRGKQFNQTLSVASVDVFGDFEHL